MKGNNNMEEYTYSILDGKSKKTIVTGMTLDIACIILKALMDEWYNEDKLLLILRRDCKKPMYYEENCESKIKDTKVYSSIVGKDLGVL